MPESDCSIAAARDKLGQAIFVLELLKCIWFVVQAKWQLVRNYLNVVDWAFVREECAVNVHLIEFLYVPNEEHSARVECYDTLVELINYARNKISELGLLVRRNLDLVYTDENVGIT